MYHLPSTKRPVWANWRTFFQINGSLKSGDHLPVCNTSLTTKAAAPRIRRRLQIAKKAEVSEAPAYLYQFALDFQVNGLRPAWHCSDIPFVFYNSHRVPVCNIDGVTERIEDEVAGAYVSFARYGNPNHEGMRKWEAYTDETKATMVFDEDSYCVPDNFDKALMDKLDEVTPGAGIFGMFKIAFLKQMESDEGGDWFY